ncbi:MAG: hypothetical protein M1820_003624 [Bogoriella megaspora]|nr:MAG: hypothetical protein M1820_003624 [Bogoriella megaspora]
MAQATRDLKGPSNSVVKVVPYKIEVPEAKIQRLKSRLADAEFSDELIGGEWESGDGVPLADVRRIATYWRDRFDWRRVESKLNALPTFMASVPTNDFGDLEVYFIHVKHASEKAIPLLFLHGWPGSVLEVTKLLPLLTDVERNGGPVFDVVVPSLPNFGFSSAVRKPGFRLEHYADTCNQLMTALGYKQYAVQAGDFGVPISKVIGMRHKNLKALLWNLVPSRPPTAASPIAFMRFIVTHLLNLYTDREARGLERTMNIQKDGWGYHHIQQTKPETIAYALNDSPIGLLAWIYEKLHDWTDEYPWTDEEVCSWVSMYWFSRNGPGASTRIYHETAKGDYPVEVPACLSDVKLGLAYFPKEIVLLPKAWARSLGQVVYQKEHDKGGHFAAWERPDAIVGDLVAMFSRDSPAYGVIDGREGFE